MAEQHAQAWIVDRCYDVANVPVYRRGIRSWRGRLTARNSDVASYAWAFLAWLTGRRDKAPKRYAVKRLARDYDRVERELRRELAR